MVCFPALLYNREGRDLWSFPWQIHLLLPLLSPRYPGALSWAVRDSFKEDISASSYIGGAMSLKQVQGQVSWSVTVGPLAFGGPNFPTEVCSVAAVLWLKMTSH